jgi:hypothetical protein
MNWHSMLQFGSSGGEEPMTDRQTTILLTSLAVVLLACGGDDETTPTGTAGSGGAGGAGGSGAGATMVPNDPPVAVDDVATTFTQLTVQIAAVLNDLDPNPGDSLTITEITQPDNGLVAIASGGKNLQYTSNAGFTGNDTFVYTVMDAAGATDEGNVTVNVAPPPTIVITSPTDNETVTGPNVSITFEVTGCLMSSPSNSPTECHVHKFLDNNVNGWEGGGQFGHYNSSGFSVGPVTDGSHNFGLVLINNDGSDAPFEPQIMDSVDFNVGGTGGAGGAP